MAASVYRFGMKDNIVTKATSMVYSTLMALVPGFAFIYAFFGAFGVLQSFLDQLPVWFGQAFGEEASTQLLAVLEKYTGNAMQLGIIGLLSFIVTMVLLCNKVWTQVNLIYHTSVNRGIVRRIVNIITFLILSVLLGAAYIAIQAKVNVWYNKMLGLKIEGWTKVLGILTPYFLNFIIIFSVTYFIPNVKVERKAALYASIAGTTALKVVNFFITSLSSMATRYSIIYGSVAALFLFFFWVYIFWVILFWSVEFAYVYQYRPDTRKFSGLPQSPAMQISEGVDIMMLIGANFKEGKGSTSNREMVEKLKIAEYRLFGFLDLLTDIKYIIPVNNIRTEFTVARPLEDLRLQELVDAIYGLDALTDDDHDTAGEAVVEQVRDKGVKSLGNLTIENLLQRI